MHQACDASLQRLGVDVILLSASVDPRCRSKRRSGQWQSWCSRAKSAIWDVRSGSRHDSTGICRSPDYCPANGIPRSRDPEDELLPTVRELGIGYVAYSPLGRDFSQGSSPAQRFAQDDYRRNSPRFQGENFYKNLQLVEQVKAIASEKACHPANLPWRGYRLRAMTLCRFRDEAAELPGRKYCQLRLC